jgi:hypothetical protein
MAMASTKADALSLILPGIAIIIPSRSKASPEPITQTREKNDWAERHPPNAGPNSDESSSPPPAGRH